MGIFSHGDDMTHGSPHDRGSADSYYSRAKIPHKIIDEKRIMLEPGSSEAAEYDAGYEQNEGIGNHKDWGIM